MEMERRAEQFKSQMDSQKYASISDEEGSSEDVTEQIFHKEVGVKRMRSITKKGDNPNVCTTREDTQQR